MCVGGWVLRLGFACLENRKSDGLWQWVLSTHVASACARSYTQPTVHVPGKSDPQHSVPPLLLLLLLVFPPTTHYQAWQTHQGHLLIEAHINNRKAGWMLLDTGGCVHVCVYVCVYRSAVLSLCQVFVHVEMVCVCVCQGGRTSHAGAAI